MPLRNLRSILFLDLRYINATGDTMTGELGMGDNPLTDVGYIDFNLANGVASAEGRAIWNDDDGTLNIGLKGGDVNLQVGQEMVVRGKNKTGGSEVNGRPVRVSGASGANPEFDFSDASNPADAGAVGLFTENVNNNSNGYVTTVGLVRDINTTGTPYGEVWSDADRIFVGTSGSLTNVYPTGVDRIIFVGLVLRANESEGVILTKVINTPFIYELSGNNSSSGSVSFYGATPIPQQTGVGTSASEIHAALVNLGLITA